MSCVGADGTCERPVEKGGLCAAHRKRKLRGSTTPLAAEVREQSTDPLEGLFRAAIAYRDELETATDAEWSRGKERFRFALRQYLWKYVPKLLRRHVAQLEQPGGVKAFLTTFGDKAGHLEHRRKPHHPHLKQSHPQHAARKATR